MKEYPYYDWGWFRDDSEAIYGLAFIAFQNYINSTIKDLTTSTVNKAKYYNLDSNFKNYEKSDIELIIGLANYSKHKDDDGELHKGTFEILKSFNLEVSKDNDLPSPPIFEGVAILSENGNLLEILSRVITWREKLRELLPSEQ
ncbi:MAG TPA: hypothetical protein VNX01_15930, partial [Bacteroidia bacterium]|nr:hypothetical protein [Bacteroidia bacterium]